MEQEPKYYVDRHGFVRMAIPEEVKDSSQIDWSAVINIGIALHGVLAFWGLVAYLVSL